MNPFNIAVIPGDGVGPEVVEQAVRCFEVVERRRGVGFRLDTFPWGAGYYLREGRVAPPDMLDRLRGYDAILLGAVGDPRVPDHLPAHQLIQVIRKGFQLYVNLRPVRLLPGVRSPLANPGRVDILFIRENTEGEYAGVGGRVHRGTPEETALQTSVFTRRGIERIVRYAFSQARRRRGHVTSVTKSNALQYAFTLWDEVFHAVAAEFRDVEHDQVLVDAMAYHLVRDPSRFDVVVASNLFGDIITDLGAAIQGSLGLAASANVGDDARYPGMFEPVHGSAPDIAGRGIANPIGTFWSVALLFDDLARRRGGVPALEGVGAALVAAIEDLAASGGPLTPDLGGDATTAQVADALVARFAARLG